MVVGPACGVDGIEFEILADVEDFLIDGIPEFGMLFYDFIGDGASLGGDGAGFGFELLEETEFDGVDVMWFHAFCGFVEQAPAETEHSFGRIHSGSDDGGVDFADSMFFGESSDVVGEEEVVSDSFEALEERFGEAGTARDQFHAIVGEQVLSEAASFGELVERDFLHAGE